MARKLYLLTPLRGAANLLLLSLPFTLTGFEARVGLSICATEEEDVYCRF